MIKVSLMEFISVSYLIQHNIFNKDNDYKVSMIEKGT